MSLKVSKFIHLRNYSQYSLSKGALRISELINFCKDQNIPATTITDFDNLFGSLEFCIEAVKNGIQPIVGTNIFLKDKKFINGYLLLLCKNEIGYKNLVKLISHSYLNNQEINDPYVLIEDLKKHRQGLICLAGGRFGIVTKNFNENRELANDITLTLNKIFSDNFFLEIQRYKGDSKNYEDFTIDLSLKLKIPLVATNENFFLKENFFKTHDALLSISQQKYVDSDDRVKSEQEFYLKSVEEMVARFCDIPQAITNTIRIAKKCSFFLEEKPPTLPKIKSDKFDENTILRNLSERGLEKRVKENNLQEKYKEYKNRLDFELNIIVKMGYSSYFLIVSDFINWAKNNMIPVGPGRGSGAGSLVAWCLSITNLDPIKFGLIFERFLNPERISLPDFDIDFCMEKRDEVIKYVQKKYGVLNVAQIITFGSFQARAALRDVGRVIQLPLTLVDDICKMIPYNPANPVNLKDFLSENKQIKKMIRNDPNIKSLFEISSNLEGLLRHASTHAAGIVIAENPLNETIPLYKDVKSEIPVTQFSMKFVEKIGLIKFDFLGLKTLTVIDETLKILKAKSIMININTIDLNDFTTYEMLKRGFTTGVFQLEGQGMRETIVKIQPDRFEDLIAIVSLYRPGPMDNIPTYINRKQKKESYDYIHNDLKEILDETYGIMVYQEQVMLIAQKLAGFSLAKADLLRRAMGKKIKSEMDAQREAFISGCIKNKIDEDKASNLFDEIAKFAGYGFNKSHAAAYAMIAYQTAYLKSNYPMEFFCALMNCDINNSEKLSIYCSEVKKIGYKIQKPDINHSDVNFLVKYDDSNNPLGIIFGLSAIKNIGGQSIFELVDERKRKGSYKDLSDLLKRISNNILNKKVLEALIFSNSLKSIEKNQKVLFDNINKILLFNTNYHKNFHENQSALFPDYDDLNEQLYIEKKHNWDLKQRLQKEIEAFGFYLSEHPTKIYKINNNEEKIFDLDNLNILQSDNKTQKINTYIAMINSKNERKTKLGKRFCFFNLSDDTNSIDAICFSEVLDNLNFDLNIGEIYFFRISKQLMSDTQRLVISDIKKLEDNRTNKNYGITIEPRKLNYIKFKSLLENHNKGSNKIIFKFFLDNKEVEIKSDESYKIDINFLDQIKSVEGITEIKKINKISS